MKEVKESYSWSDADTEDFFAFLGKYLYFFQWLEGKLDEVLLLAWGDGNWNEGQARLAVMTNNQKVNEVHDVVLNSSDFSSIQTWTDWCNHFVDVMRRLHELRQQRNAIMHSQYLFEFTELGLPPLRSKRNKIDGEACFDQEHLGKDAQEEIFRNVVTLAVDMNFIHVQLVHAFRSLFDFGISGNNQRWKPVSAWLFDASKILDLTKKNS